MALSNEAIIALVSLLVTGPPAFLAILSLRRRRRLLASDMDLPPLVPSRCFWVLRDSTYHQITRIIMLREMDGVVRGQPRGGMPLIATHPWSNNISALEDEEF